MAVIRVGVQAPAGGAGQVVDLDGPSATIASITNASGESIQYSVDGGVAWTTVASGASSGTGGTVLAGLLRMRKVSSGAYPAPVDVDAVINGLTDPQLTAAQLAAVPVLMTPDRGSVTSVMLVGDSNTAFSWDQGPTCTGMVNNGDGTATVSFGGSHNWTVGQSITVNNSISQAVNCFNAPVVAMSNSGTFSVTYTLTARTSPIVSGVAASTSTLYMTRYSCVGFAGWLQALQSKPLHFTLAAAGGADSTQALTLYNDAMAEAASARTSDIVLMIGTNDIFARAWDFATAQAAIKALADRIAATANGARVWWVTPYPMSSTASAWSSAKQTVWNRITRWIWRYAGQIGATPIDSGKAAQNGLTFVNPAISGSNVDASAGFLGADNTHSTNLGALAVARAIDAAIRQTASAQTTQFQGAHSLIQAQGNPLPNPSLTGTTGTTSGAGTVSGTVPTGYVFDVTTGMTCTLTSPARTVAADGDADGANLQVIPSVAAGTWKITNTASIHASVTAGEVREASWPLTFTGAAGVTGVELIVFGSKSSGGNENLGFTSTSQAISGAFTGVIRAPRWTVPANMTSLTMFLRITQTGTPAGTFTLGKPALELIE